MLGPEVTLAASAALLPVVLWCTTCLVRRAAAHRGDPVPWDAEAWHAVMGVAMLVALWTTVSTGWAWGGAAVFVAATTWCVVRASGDRAAGLYRRLGVMTAAMAVMLVPSGAATAATARAAPSMPMSTSTSPSMSSMSMPLPGSAATWLTGTSAWVVAGVLGLVALAALRATRRPSSRRTRLYAGCELVMAATMVVAALAMV